MKTGPLRQHADILLLSAEDFWERITGIADFRARLIRASTTLAWLLKRRSEDEIARIKAEAILLFGDDEGRLDLEALANALRTALEERQALLARALVTPDDD